MATMLYVIVDPAASTVSWVNAGHLPPLMVVARRAPRFLEGRALGAARRAAVPDLRGGVARLEPRRLRCCSTRTGSSSARASIIDDGMAAARRAATARGPIPRGSATTCSRRSCPRAAPPTTWRS